LSQTHHRLDAQVRRLERADEVRPLPPVDEREERATLDEQRPRADGDGAHQPHEPGRGHLVEVDRSVGEPARAQHRLGRVSVFAASMRVPLAYGGSVITAST
jgi:hypothetical protein